MHSSGKKCAPRGEKCAPRGEKCVLAEKMAVMLELARQKSDFRSELSLLRQWNPLSKEAIAFGFLSGTSAFAGAWCANDQLTCERKNGDINP